MTKKIFLVSAGCYSDYSVYAAFDDRDLAQKFCDAFNNNPDTEGKYHEYEIEERTLNPHEPELRAGFRPYFVRIKTDGEVKEVYCDDSAAFFDNEQMAVDVKGSLYTHCFAKDKEHAVKIANERRIMYLAEAK